MFRIKNRFEVKAEEANSPLIERMSHAVNGRLHRVANKLQDRSERLSTPAKKWMLALFLLIFGGASVLIAWRSINTRSGRTAVAVQSITACPLSSRPGGPSPSSASGGVSRKEYEMVRSFHHYLDSLGASSTGALMRDSILRVRPGLLDSIEIIERMYLEK